MMTPDIGAVRALSNEAYHKGPGLSVSGVKRLLRSPWHYFAPTQPHTAPAPEPTAAMFAGTLCHCAALEPKEWPKRYAVGPEVSSKSVKAWKDFEAANPQRECITPRQAQVAQAQAAALREHPVIGELLGRGEPELSIYWMDPATGALCKARPDWVHHCGTKAHPSVILLDVKTSGDASPEGFAKSVGNFGYHLQADWYCGGYELATGVRAEAMVFGVVENEFPYATAAYVIDDEALAYARERNRKALNTYAACLESGEWPGYSRDLQVISLSRWAMQ